VRDAAPQGASIPTCGTTFSIETGVSCCSCHGWEHYRIWVSQPLLRGQVWPAPLWSLGQNGSCAPRAGAKSRWAHRSMNTNPKPSGGSDEPCSVSYLPRPCFP
jgi:hypothetical protein